ncbi:phosphatidylglycerol lysyltransferase domain-containing protein [Parasphaerochaeta coccoides]|nr:phosphatidylglycerol lysyltransferase domain-containing protein [Parasphaerochaeta coccoides]
MSALVPFASKHDTHVASFIDSAGNTQYMISGINRRFDGNMEKFAVFPAGYPGREMMVSIMKKVSVISFIPVDDVMEWTRHISRDFPHLAVTEDRDNADYVYRKQDLITLQGPQLHKKLAHALKFEAEHSEHFIVDVADTPQADMISVLDQWAAGKDVVEDYEAVRISLELRKELNLEGIAVYARPGEPVAFTLVEYDGSDRVITHTEKAIPSYKGVYQFLNRALAMSLPPDVVDINREQDLGIPGLRQAKKTYQPYTFVTKYKIELP